MVHATFLARPHESEILDGWIVLGLEAQTNLVSSCHMGGQSALHREDSWNGHYCLMLLLLEELTAV